MRIRLNRTANPVTHTLTDSGASAIAASGMAAPIVNDIAEVIAAAQGICFAVSANLTKYVAGKLILEGRVKRAQLGIAGQVVNLSERMIGYNKLPTRTGVYISEVIADANAQNSELRRADIIIGLNEKSIASVDDLHKILNDELINQSVTVHLLRGGIRESVRVLAGELK